MIGILKEVDEGLKPKEVCRRYGISPQTFYRWKAQLSYHKGVHTHDGGQFKRLRRLEIENRRLKQVVADLSLDNQALRAAVKRRAIQKSSMATNVDIRV